MKIIAAKNLLTLNIDLLNIEKLQQYQIKLLDAIRWCSRDYYSDDDLIKNGFFVMVACELPFLAPKDIWLLHNLNERYNVVQNKLNALYNS